MSDTPPQPPAASPDTGSAAGAPLPASSGPLEDAFLLAGLFQDEEAAASLQALAEGHALAAKEKAELDAARISALEAQIAEWEETRDSVATEAEQLKEEKKRQDAQAGELLPRYRSLLERQSARMRDLLAKRPSYPVRRMWKKLNDYQEMSKELAAHFLFEEEQRLEVDRVQHKAQSERYQWNQKDHDRREKYLEGQLAQAEQRLQQVDASVARIRMLGMTRRTAGFLVWAGYLSFAGFGWYAGETIQSLAERDSDFLQALLMLLARGIRTLIEHLGMGPGVTVLLLAPLLLLALVLGVFFLTDRFLSRFDPKRWPGRGPGRRSSSLSPLGPFQSPFKDVGRADYIQILARMPLFYLWIVVPAAAAALFALGGDAPSAELAALGDPVQTFAYTFLGLVLCVAIAAAILLYAVFVVGPRHRRYLGEEGVTARAAVWMNVELAVFLGAMAVLVIAPDLLRTALPGLPSLWQRGSTAGIWLLPALGGFAVSYGLIYKGIFSDQASITREVESLFESLERASVFSWTDEPEDSSARWRSGLADLRKEIDDRWEKVELWSKPAVRFRLRRFRWSNLTELLNPQADKTSQGGFEILVADVLFEPELVEQVNQVVEEVAEIRQALDDVHARNQEIATRLAELEKVDANGRITSLHQQIADERARQWRERAEMATAHQELVARCKNALQVGEFLRQDLPTQELTMVRQTA